MNRHNKGKTQVFANRRKDSVLPDEIFWKDGVFSYLPTTTKIAASPFNAQPSNSMDFYHTLSTSSESIHTEKRSRFLAFAIPVSNEEEAKHIVAEYKKKYYDARHVCYAYIVGLHSEITRSSDDGEPSGTAGRPLLTQIAARGLTFTVGIVVRYFGGVKLGTGPLGVAYKTAIAQALDLAEVKKCIILASFHISAPYADADTAMRFVREAGGNISARNYTTTHTIMTVEIRQGDEATLRERLSKILSLEFIKKQQECDSQLPPKI